jgi:hypothetical protein
MARDNGIGVDYTLSYPVSLAIMAFLSIAIFNVLELTLVIFTSFRQWSGLYFYSLLVATWGIVPYAVGFFLKFYNVDASTTLYLTLIAIGWPCMVTAQSLVLYSRLYLIARGTFAGGRWVLIMIIFNGIICHVPIIVLLFGANSSHPDPFITPYSIYEKVQVSIFFLQECCISGLYVYRTMKMLRSEGNIRPNSRKVMTHLVWVNILIIILDITLLSIEYAGLYDLQVTYKAAVYSVKLKMEFAILNKLVALFQGPVPESASDPRSRSHRTDLSTFRKTNKKSLAGDGTVLGSTLGHSAYARMEEAGPEISLKDMEVVKTTEVRVETSKRDVNDVELTGLAEEEGNRGTRAHSVSSSEVRMVENGY